MSGDLSRERLPLPIKFQGVDSAGSLINLYTVNADGTITFHTAIDPLDASLTNLGITASQAEINALDGVGQTVTVTAVAGASNVSTVTVTVKDGDGNTVAAVHHLDLVTTSDAAGTTISATSYSGSLVAGTGAILITHTAKHAFRIATAATGIFVGSLTDTAKTADYIAVKKPLGAGVVVSSAMAFG